jgi:hypothetical protein
MPQQRMFVSAVMSADRRPPSISEISPKKSCLRSRAFGLLGLPTIASPSAMTKNPDPAEPRLTTGAPAS